MRLAVVSCLFSMLGIAFSMPCHQEVEILTVSGAEASQTFGALNCVKNSQSLCPFPNTSACEIENCHETYVGSGVWQCNVTGARPYRILTYRNSTTQTNKKTGSNESVYTGDVTCGQYWN